MKKTYYYDLSQEELKKISLLPTKPSILLHTCCAVCVTVPLEQLSPFFKITLYFNNSNIFPIEEYTRRLDELKRFLQLNYPQVELIITSYQYDAYMEDLRPLALDKEGNQRCKLCYRKRMNEAYEYANSHNFDYFCTIMTISRQKDSFTLNSIGNELANKYPNTKYFYSDFKKHQGQDRSIELRDLNNLYQQTYCGCEYSKR